MKKDIKGYAGLEYITLSVPVRQTKHGEVIDAKLESIERAIAEKIILEHVPVRGGEVKFLRKLLGMSLNDFGSKFGLTSTGVLKWEKEPQKYIGRMNELGVRMLVIELLRIQGAATGFSDLVQDRPAPIHLTVKVA
ncbi:MAG: hypothetical protein ABIQ95_05590 [Bdellovibrionia bacterium]